MALLEEVVVTSEGLRHFLIFMDSQWRDQAVTVDICLPSSSYTLLAILDLKQPSNGDADAFFDELFQHHS
ncbi:hypothetical protein llap_9823 [Limosa lapponica baueri]|uniref:Uncharacterized protein n=1 Tax=Limosa lapponica baueri TaxID=1758121 RepID=A0A2I0U1C5_LIMLA|nr:hypothetical protein llap_9823 [Limosa lapponica baueri]